MAPRLDLPKRLLALLCAVIAVTLATGCKQGLNEVCQRDSDCAGADMVCNRGTDPPTCTLDVDVIDAAPRPDATAIDASTVDAPEIDASEIDASEIDAGPDAAP